MELKGRLKLITEKIPKCDSLCDVGTDHAYIPIFSIENKICIKAIASDVRIGPLEIAKENIRLAGLKDKIETRLGGGLQPIRDGEVDTYVIAGMGGVLICDILKESYNKAQSAKTIILQPMNAIEILREWLLKNGFEIVDEELTSEGEKIYNVIVCKWTGTIVREPEIYYYVGRRLIERKDPLLATFLEKKLKQTNTILKEMKNIREESVDSVSKYEYLRDNYVMLLRDRID